MYAKPPFGNAAQVLDYLGRYVHRVALSNHRILSLENGQVRFSYRDYQADGEPKEMVLPAAPLPAARAAKTVRAHSPLWLAGAALPAAKAGPLPRLAGAA